MATNLIFRFLRIHPVVDPDKVILDLTPEDERALNNTSSFHHVDFPMRNLSEIVQFNLVTDLRDSSTDSLLSGSDFGYEVNLKSV